jgi:hypothetical protein
MPRTSNVSKTANPRRSPTNRVARRNDRRRFVPFVVPGLAIVVAIAGCSPQIKPERTVPVANKTVELHQLFTDPNGYTVYRFWDQGDYRYYVVGPNGAQMLPSTTRETTDTVTGTQFIPVETHGGNGGGGGGGGGGGHHK